VNTAPESLKVRILLVDDQPARLLSYETILHDLGHELVRARSGSEALARLLEEEFAVILLDVSMPGMDGFELAALVHDHPRFEKTPIIFVTGVHMTDVDRLKGYSLGAVDYVYVPIVPEILRSKVCMLAELYQKRRELQVLNTSLERANAELSAANTSLQAERTRDLEAANAELARANGALKTEVDERRRLEQALVETDRRKDEFLAMLGHELRNPLAPILNGVHFMRLRSLADPELEWCRDMIGRQAEQLTRLVEELLDVSRITQGKIKLQQARVALETVVSRAVETNRPLIEARRQQLSLDLPAQPVWVQGDLTRLAQAVGNLLNNAAKFTGEGGSIRVSVETVGSADGSQEALVRVRDTGIGIPPEMLPRVFELFTQVERPIDRPQGGLGIGLALVRRLVELHGGRVEAHSPVPGGGCEFVVALPLPAPAHAAEGEVPPEKPGARATTAPEPAGRRARSRARPRVLVVDDNHDSAHSLGLFLKEMGHEVQLAFGGLEGLRAVPVFQPEVVFLDIGMPEVDGYEAARRMRELPNARSITLVALTGYGQAEDKRRARNAGFDMHLVKPVSRKVLDELFSDEPERARAADEPEPVPAPPGPATNGELRQAAHDLRTPLNALCGTCALLLETALDPKQREYAEIIRRSAEAIRQLADELAGSGDGDGEQAPGRVRRLVALPARPLRVLVVDDDPVNRTAILHLVDMLGHRGDAAVDGQAALAAVEKAAFDVVLMDVQLGGLSGPEAARRIRSGRRNGNCPRILGLSGSAIAADRDACRAAGMEAVLQKPVDPDVLRDALAAGPARAARTEELLDARILSRLRAQPPAHGRAALVEFLQLYAADAPEQIELLRRAAERGDVEDLASTAHRLTGSSAAVGAKLLATLASRIEVFARAGDASAASPLVTDLERAWPATREALASASSRGAAAG
jgi:CheY-like chemotaxis protein